MTLSVANGIYLVSAELICLLLTYLHTPHIFTFQHYFYLTIYQSILREDKVCLNSQLLVQYLESDVCCSGLVTFKKALNMRKKDLICLNLPIIFYDKNNSLTRML
jgi:hypothetical protein